MTTINNTKDKDASNASESKAKKIILLNQFNEALEEFVVKLVDWGFETVSVRNPNEFSNLAGSSDIEVGLVDLTGNVDLEALIQIKTFLESKNPSIAILGVFAGKLKYSMFHIYKLGLVGFFQIPLEEELFANRLFELAPLPIDIKKVGIEGLVKVNMAALSRQEPLPFDVFVYLAANQKVVMLRKGGAVLENQTREKLEASQKWSLYIRRSDLNVFQKDLGAQLFKAPTEDLRVKEHIQSAMRNFFSDAEFSNDEAAQVLQNLRCALNNQMLNRTDTKEVWKATQGLVAQKLTYQTHSQNVASYCALFGRVLNIPEVDDLALAGLLHDIGLGELPAELLWKPEKNMSDSERAQYRLHPGFAKHSVQKGLKLKDSVINAILYHHERLDGSGYPYGMTADKIPLAAKILAFADEFDKLTSLRPGYPQRTPREAIVELAGLEGGKPSSVFDPSLMQPLVDLFYEKPAVKEVVKIEKTEKGESLKMQMSKFPPRTNSTVLPETDRIHQFRKQLREHFNSK